MEYAEKIQSKKRTTATLAERNEVALNGERREANVAGREVDRVSLDNDSGDSDVALLGASESEVKDVAGDVDGGQADVARDDIALDGGAGDSNGCTVISVSSLPKRRGEIGCELT